MGYRNLGFVLGMAFAACIPQTVLAQGSPPCAVTKAPASAFEPPAGFDRPVLQDDSFLLGNNWLWAFVRPTWKLNLNNKKLPYFSQFYDWQTERPPKMSVVARRLDAPAPLVWADHINGAGPSFRYGEQPDLSKPGFMVTALDIPSAGCWEVSAQYEPPQRNRVTLTYTVLVEP
jgi:hypothetical protein